MIKRFVILRRKQGMSVKDFRKYWKEVHGPLIKKIPGIKKYIQYHVRSEINDNADAHIDGIAELWFDSEESQKKAWSTPEYQKVVADEPNLFDMNSKSVHPVMTEDIIEIIK